MIAAPAYRAKLRAWAESGVEMLLHGWSHRDETGHHRGVASFKARHMTAGEGEFLGLSREEAARRLRDGRAALEDAIGRPVTGFVAPAWLCGDGARAALRTLREKLETAAWDKAALAAVMKETLAAHAIKMPQLAIPLRLVVTGRTQTPSIDALLALFQKEVVLDRLRGI